VNYVFIFKSMHSRNKSAIYLKKEEKDPEKISASGLKTGFKNQTQKPDSKTRLKNQTQKPDSEKKAIEIKQIM
jgi:hypothetical protein